MAKIKLFPALVTYQVVHEYFYGDLELGKFSSKSATFRDDGTWSKVIFEGKNLAHSGDKLTKGTVDKIIFKDNDGDTIVTFSNMKFDAKQLSKLMHREDSGRDGIEDLVAKLRSGNDVITGSSNHENLFGGAGNDKIKGGGGEDSLIGGLGNDTLTGGAGADWFVFRPGEGHDKVTDFDAEGGGSKQDYINLEGASYEIIAAGKNTVIKLSDGSTLTLLGVSSDLITAEDFVLN